MLASPAMHAFAALICWAMLYFRLGIIMLPSCSTVFVISLYLIKGAYHNILSYVLDTKKTVPELCGTLGDFETDNITPKQVYKEFQRVKNLFGKENGGRTYIHGTVSWAAGEISGEEAADFAREYLP